MRVRKLLIFIFVFSFLFSCQSAQDEGLKISYEKYTLKNGLQVVLHEDKSDPIVGVAILYHVGSAKEIKGRTGFAHLFEHLLFQSSENLKNGEFIKTIPNLGGTFNGGTGTDQTVYYEVVPNDALEKVLWIESDRLGFFINTVTEPNLEKEKQIVKNEKRQVVDNRPYGHTNYVVNSNLYPSSHPYSWQVIGSLEDLQASTLKNVQDFYEKWYGPNNATLVIAGDFDAVETKGWVEKYFGEIKSHGNPASVNVAPVVLNESKKLFHEDNFARLPHLTMVWPTVKQYEEDSYALNALGQLLSRGKKSPFYKVLVKDKKLTSRAPVYNNSSELAGKFTISIRGFKDIDLDDINAGIQEAFQKFEAEGVTDADLDRIKAGIERNFYNGMSSILGKAFQLAMYNVFAGDPGYASADIEKIKAVTIEDVNRVYNKYIKGKNFVAASFVPKGKPDMALEGSVVAAVVEEKVTAEDKTKAAAADEKAAEIEKTASNIDRSVSPPLGKTPEIAPPPVWTGEIENGMKVLGIGHRELPLVQFSIRLNGGMMLDDPAKIGVANIVSQMLMAGTKNKTPEELEEAIDGLGSAINLRTGKQSVTVTGNTLRRNYEKTMDLVEEILLEPRWDEKEFDLIKQRVISTIRQREARPNAVAGNVFNKLVYGGHILANSTTGTVASVESITIDDLKEYYNKYFSPSAAVMHIAGDIEKADVLASLTGLNSKWVRKDFEIPVYEFPKKKEKAKIYFVDIPGSKQSVFQAGYLSMSQKDPDYYPATVMNYNLGGGISSRFFQILRIQKGYTYGAGSYFGGSNVPGPFTVYTSVQSAVTYDTMRLIKEILENYRSDFSAKDLEDTKNSLIKSNARAFETLRSLIGMLQNISTYSLPHDYVKQREAIVQNMTIEKISDLATKYVDAGNMSYVIVGDAKTQLKALKKIGFGNPVLVDRDGKKVK